MGFELIRFPGPEDMARTVAAAWLAEIETAHRAGRSFSTALSGGRFVRSFFGHTADLARERETAWNQVHFFWADERCVPPDDPESNFKVAQETLFTRLNIPAVNIHRLRGELEPEEAARQANDELQKTVPANPTGLPVLDLVLLGMGEDGHVASLFPLAGPAVTNCTAAYLPVYDSPKPPPRRLTLSYPAIAGAREVWVLASGQGKADALQESLKEGGKTPLARVTREKSLFPVKIFCDFF